MRRIGSLAVSVESWSAEDFLSRELPPKTPLIEGLLHRRDLVAFVARRRHGKTTFVLNLAIAGAVPADEFVGYRIPREFRSLLLTLEDDPCELQSKLKLMSTTAEMGGRLRLVTREDFSQQSIRIDIDEDAFRDAVTHLASFQRPDLIVFDNLAQVIGADYSNAQRIHKLMDFSYRLARDNNAAIIHAAHPRKRDNHNEIHLADDAEAFAEQTMGSSHFINSTGSIWAIERNLNDGSSVFLGGRQRGDGHAGNILLSLDDKQCFQMLDDRPRQLKTVINTPQRLQAWNLLPDHPQPFGYREAERAVSPALKSASTFASWFKLCRHVGVIVPSGDKHMKASGLPQMSVDVV